MHFESIPNDHIQMCSESMRLQLTIAHIYLESIRMQFEGIQIHFETKRMHFEHIRKLIYIIV